MKPSTLLLAGLVATALAGCIPPPAASTNALAGVVSAGTSPYAILDLAAGTVTWHTTLPSGAGDPTLRTTRMAFKRVVQPGGDVLVGVFEVTQAQWRTLYGTPAPGTWPWAAVPTEIVDHTAAHGDAHPAYNIDHETAAAVLAAYAPSGTARLALPTAAQWTAACGTSSGWWWGSTSTPAQVEANAAVRESVLTTGRISAGGVDTGGPLEVGARAPSPAGFYDLHGNVWELIAGGATARGGSWRDGIDQSRADSVIGSDQGMHQELDHALVGLRLVLVP
jgi:hypothetical protein